METNARGARTITMAAVLFLGSFQGMAHGEDAWRANFEDTCGQTSDAMNLSVGQLSTLLERCAQLQKVVETQDDSVRKVYLKRLQLCSNLYSYVLEYKRNQAPAK
jgi:C4-dicarboxylate-specific signal transduction histidine kinase